MFIDQLTNADALPALGAMVQFAARRQPIIQHNIANADTPNFQPRTVSSDRFRASLREAVNDRRREFGGHRGDLHVRDSREVEWKRTVGGGRRMVLNPTTPSDNILFHDRNNRDLERMMQDLAENVSAFRVATELLKSNMETLTAAITERP